MLLIQEHRWPAVPRIGFRPLYLLIAPWEQHPLLGQVECARQPTYAVPILIELS